jgi:hypothetical protein
MDIGWFRDLVICIWGLVATVVIFLAVLSYSLYRRTRSVLNSVEAVSNRAASVVDSVEAISKAIRDIVAYVGDEVVRPVIQVTALVQGIRQGIDAIGRLFRKREQEGGGDD